ncbi:MAG: hypothetical protein E6X52_08570 [Actinomyces sp.]|nr:hypothetical protein [Actinomyces sp.]MDU4964771.1 hypothetical protein [Staphylococcus warneri]
MIIKKTYAENNYIIIKLTNIGMIGDSTMLTGEVLKTTDPMFKQYKEVQLAMSELVEVLSI